MGGLAGQKMLLLPPPKAEAPDLTIKHQGKVPDMKPPPKVCSAWLPFLNQTTPRKLFPLLLPTLVSWTGIWQHQPRHSGKPHVHPAHVDKLQTPVWAPSVPSKPAFTNLQPHSEVPVRQQVDAPLHHVFGQLSMGWQWCFSCVGVVWLHLSKGGNLIWKIKPSLKPW